MSNKFEIMAVKPSRRLMDAIRKNRPYLSADNIKSALKYNVLTVPQLMDITGARKNRIFVSSSESKSPKSHKNKIKLTRVYPFASSEGVGQVFILRDEECDQFILQSNK